MITAALLTASACIIVPAAVSSESSFGGGKKGLAILIAASAVSAAAAFLYFGASMYSAGAAAFSSILCFASYQDARTHECGNYHHIMIILAALAGRDVSGIPYMLLSALLCGGITLTAYWVSGGRLGAADVKLSFAAGFFLCINRAAAGLILGLLAAITVNLLTGGPAKDRAFPLVPYLALGYIAALFI